MGDRKPSDPFEDDDVEEELRKKESADRNPTVHGAGDKKKDARGDLWKEESEDPKPPHVRSAGNLEKDPKEDPRKETEDQTQAVHDADQEDPRKKMSEDRQLKVRGAVDVGEDDDKNVREGNSENRRKRGDSDEDDDVPEEVGKRLVVLDIPENVRETTLKLSFEKATLSGAIECIDYKQGSGTAVLTFKDEEGFFIRYLNP